MDRPMFVVFLLIIFVLIGSMAYLGYMYDIPTSQPCDQDAKYHILVLERLPTDSTGAFFDRVRETIDCLNEQQYIVYSFLPIFDVNTPTIVGATIMYEVKK